MRKIILDKVTLNIGCGSDKDKLQRAEKLLQKISKNKPIITKTRKRTLFGMAKKRPIGVKLTLRDKEATEFLKNVFIALDNKIKKSQINGDNFSLGVKEYIDLPNMNYDPDIGILGMDVCVNIKRPGFRVEKRRIKQSKIGKRHKISIDDCIEWLNKTFKVEVIE